MARKGYAADELDELLERVANALDAGEPCEELIASTELRLDRRGYDIDQVDAFLARLAPERRTARPPASPVAESRGIFGFLRRR